MRIHRGKVKQGKFCPSNQGAYALDLAKFKDGTDVELQIRKPKRSRSLPQNKYYWGVVILLISEATGFSRDEAHDSMRAKFLTDMVEGRKTSLPRIKSTTELSTVEFCDYVAQIQQFAAEFLDLFIPDPENSDEW